MELYTCLVLFDLAGGPRLLDALGSRYPVFWFKLQTRETGKRAVKLPAEEVRDADDVGFASGCLRYPYTFWQLRSALTRRIYQDRWPRRAF
jgi:hypothetical protein